MRIRPAPVVALAALVALAGCGEQQPDGERPDRRFLGTDSTCQKHPDRTMTRPFQSITVEGDEVLVEPDTVVQPPKAGIFGWRSEDYHWRITYADEQSPISPESIMRVGGRDTSRTAARQAARSRDASDRQSGQASDRGNVSVSGEPGELVWAGVREDAPCRYYKFDVEVWGGGLDDTLTVDPGDFVQPYSY